MCRERGAPMPAGQVLIYPVIEPTSTRELPHVRDRIRQHPRRRCSGTGGSTSTARLPSPAYLVAPARAESHEGLPPAVVVTAGFDVLHSEGVAYAQQLRAAKVPVVHRDYPGLFHGFVTIMPFAAGASARELLWADMRAAARAAVKASA